MRTTSDPRLKAPPGSCDCHFHIFGPYEIYPLSGGRHYTPHEALVPAYLDMAETLGLQRMVIVQASVYGTDNSVTLDAVQRFGGERARAVAVIDDSFDAIALRRLRDAGVRGVRFNLVSGNGTPVEQLAALSRKIAPLDFHLQLYCSGETLAELAPMLPGLPVPVVIDHLGGVKADLGVDHTQFQALLRLLDSGRTWVKLCSYRASARGEPWEDTAPNVKALAARAPERCLWGTDWPHSNMGDGPFPDDGRLLDQFFEWVPDSCSQHRILVDNPANLYGFTPV